MNNFEVVECCCLTFALLTYITNFKEINKEIVYEWRKIIYEGREQYYLENYPKGYFLLKSCKRNNNFYYQTIPKQYYYKDMLYNRKMMKK